MKKLLISLCAALALVSCGSDHHEYAVNVDDVPFTSSDFKMDRIQESSELTQIFEVVPGTYTITADYQSEGVTSGCDVNVTLKFKLLKPVVPDEKFDKLYAPEVVLFDANDEVPKGENGISAFALKLGEYKSKSNGQFLVQNEEIGQDAFMEFKEFLSSEPGTEAEFTFGNMYGMQLYKVLENVTGMAIYFNSSLDDRDGKLNNYYWSWKE